MMSAALADALRTLAASVVPVVAHSGTAAMQQVMQQAEFDLIVLDLGLPDMDGFDLLARIRARCPSVPIVVVSATEKVQDMRRAIAAGALGFVAKSTPPARLLQAMRRVLAGELEVPDALREPAAAATGQMAAAGGETLSDRQLDVLRLVCAGKSNKFIAQELALSEKTVKGHITAIFKALDVVNRTQAALAARERGLFDDAAARP